MLELVFLESMWHFRLEVAYITLIRFFTGVFSSVNDEFTSTYRLEAAQIGI